jgi:hypothetical protein
VAVTDALVQVVRAALRSATVQERVHESRFWRSSGVWITRCTFFAASSAFL